jgi:hypothetical protein
VGSAVGTLTLQISSREAGQGDADVTIEVCELCGGKLCGQYKIDRADALWSYVAQEDIEGMAQQTTIGSTRTTLEPSQLKQVLALQCEHELSGKNQSKLRQWLESLRRHQLEMVLLVGALIILSLLLFRVIPSQQVIIAARSLESGHMLQQGDLSAGRAQGAAYLDGDPADLSGWILSRDVPQGKPLRTEDVSRLQVVATRDIPSGTKIEAGEVRLSWSPYQRDAELKVNNVIGSQARYDIQDGKVVLGDFIAAPSS